MVHHELPNRDNNLPQKGDSEWHSPLNAAIQQFNADIFIQDEGSPSSNGYTPTENALYINTASENDDYYRGNGSNWDLVGSLASATSTARQVIRAPNDGIPTADIPTGDFAERTVIVPDDFEITLHTWGGYTVPSMTAPTGVEVRLLDDTESILTASNTVREASTSGLYTDMNDSGSDSLYLLRLVNESGTDYTSAAGNDGLGAFFGYAIE